MTGFICLDKPEGITSFTAVNRVRRITGEKKAGHSGTLDPMATGVLMIALGGATRFIELLPSHDKSYFAVIKLGVETDTLDITGKIVSQVNCSVGESEVRKAVSCFVGNIKQKPPMYSAIKKDGVRLYELARKGVETEREERDVRIGSINVVDFNAENQEFSLEVECSSGTYIRSLAEDIGKKLGVPAVLKRLVRTCANGYNIEKAVTPEKLEEIIAQGNLRKIIIPVDSAMADYEKITVTQAQSRRFSNGGELDMDRIRAKLENGYYRVYSPENVFLGIGEADMNCGQLKVKKVYNER